MQTSKQKIPPLYFDNAATTYPKPLSVRRAVLRSMQTAGNFLQDCGGAGT